MPTPLPPSTSARLTRLINGLQKLESWSKRIPMDASPVHRPHVHHQAVHRAEHDAPVLDPPLHRGPHRPPAGDAMNEVRVNRKAADRVASGHPWIFTSDMTDRDGAQPGAAVRVADPRGRPLGTAHYSSASQISLRMLVAAGRRDRPRFLFAPPARRRSSTATTVVRNTDAYRVVHGEADLLPALVVDRYGDYLVHADPRPGHGRRQGRDRLLPGGDLPARTASSPATTSTVRTKEQLPLETAVVSRRDSRFASRSK